ncbi:MAG: beta-xylosidase [Acidobacteria bacterium]|nr:MAG: beta-xylosidase [Acidobacteriota bacterium]
MRTRRPSVCRLLALLLPTAGPIARVSAADAAFPVTVKIDAARPRGELKPIWRFFGADEPNYATMKDGRKLFRAHNLLTTGDGTPALKWGSTNAYTEDARGNPVYDWTILDRIFDTYRQRDLKPYAQIGFMPQALSVKPEPYQHEWRPGLPYNRVYTGWAHPPKDYGKWAELVYQWVKHSVERYGRAEVEGWYWEVWNEPNIAYWQGTPEEFHKLHDYAVDAVRRALPTARVGGPDTAGGGGPFLRGFLEHCLRGINHATGKTGTPLDFLSFHAKGAPKFVDGHVQMGIANQLRTIDGAFAIIASFPELKDKPIVIGESDPEGCAACQGPQLGYRNGTMYSSYTAAVFARKHDLAEKHGVDLEGALTWAFEFEDQPYFAGFRALASNGLDLPVLNVFRMFGKMGGRRLSVQSTADPGLEAMLKDGVRTTPDVSALASLEARRLSVLVWHYHDDDVPGPDAAVELSVSGLPLGRGEARVQHYRIDESHSNSYAAWKSMGSPIAPDERQYAQLEAAGKLAAMEAPAAVPIDGGRASVAFTLPRQAVSLLVLEW